MPKKNPKAPPKRIILRPLALDPLQDYSIEEAAVLLCTSVSGLYRDIRLGRLTLNIKKRGRRSRISGADILRANNGSSPND